MVAIRLSSRERKYSLVAGIVCIVYGFTMYVVHAKTLAKTPISAPQPTAVRYTPPTPKKIKPSHKAAVAAVHSEAPPSHVTQQAAAPVPVVSPPVPTPVVASAPLPPPVVAPPPPMQASGGAGPRTAPPAGYGFAPSTSNVRSLPYRPATPTPSVSDGRNLPYRPATPTGYGPNQGRGDPRSPDGRPSSHGSPPPPPPHTSRTNPPRDSRR